VVKAEVAEKSGVSDWTEEGRCVRGRVRGGREIGRRRDRGLQE
jgi:hypothetical protein